MSNIRLTVQGKGTTEHPFKNQDLGELFAAAEVAANEGTTTVVDGRVATDTKMPLREGTQVVVLNPIDNG